MSPRQSVLPNCCSFQNRNLKTSQVSLNFEFNHFHNSLGGDAVEGGCLIADLSVEVCPELDEEEGVLGALAVQHLMNKLLNS